MSTARTPAPPQLSFTNSACILTAFHHCLSRFSYVISLKMRSSMVAPCSYNLGAGIWSEIVPYLLVYNDSITGPRPDNRSILEPHWNHILKYTRRRRQSCSTLCRLVRITAGSTSLLIFRCPWELFVTERQPEALRWVCLIFGRSY